MNKRISLEEAKYLSLTKWEKIVDNGGKNCLSGTLLDNYGTEEGFCLRHRSYTENYINCDDCELCEIIGECGTESAFRTKWYFSKDDVKLSYAQQMLDAIKSIDINEVQIKQKLKQELEIKQKADKIEENIKRFEFLCKDIKQQINFIDNFHEMDIIHLEENLKEMIELLDAIRNK